MKIIKLVFLFIIISMAIFYTVFGEYNKPVENTASGHIPDNAKNNTQRHVYDKAGIIRAPDLKKFDWMLDLIEKESDLDIKFLFLKTVGNASIEEVAVKKMDEYGVGLSGRKERGVLFLYVMDEKRLRIEVGYGLEAYLPDAFVSYLIRNQADAFFKASNPGTGLRLLIRILQHRIREATKSGSENNCC